MAPDGFDEGVATSAKGWLDEGQEVTGHVNQAGAWLTWLATCVQSYFTHEARTIAHASYSPTILGLCLLWISCVAGIHTPLYSIHDAGNEVRASDLDFTSILASR